MGLLVHMATFLQNNYKEAISSLDTYMILY
jgi:hypothetical protein